LLDSLLRRTDFLKETVSDLGLESQVRVVRDRAEDFEDPQELVDVPGRFDVVVSRAVAPLGKLLDWTAHLVAPGGQILALKGETAGSELKDAVATLRKLGMRAELVIPEGCQSTVIQVTYS
jgi:16S rRNA (guanine527-N7)-methyltransferase